MLRAIFINVLPLIFVGGCATEYTCGEVPGSKCKNVDQVYEETNKGVKDYRKGMYSKGTTKSFEENLKISPSINEVEKLYPGDPLLSKPEVLRVLITSWEDADKDLNSGGYIFIRLRDSEWMAK